MECTWKHLAQELDFWTFWTFGPFWTFATFWTDWTPWCYIDGVLNTTSKLPVSKSMRSLADDSRLISWAAECIADCSGPGPADQAVEFWLGRL